MKYLYFLLFIMLRSLTSAAQTDTVEVDNYKNSWWFYDDDTKLPVVRMQDFEGNVIYFEVSKESNSNEFLKIEYPGIYSIFIDEKLIVTATGEHYLNLAQYFKTQTLGVTIYADQLNPFALITKSYKTVDETANLQIEDVVIVNPKEKNHFRNFYGVAFITLLMVLAMLKTYFPKTLKEYYKLSRAVSFREMDENLLKSRVFTGGNLSFYFFMSLQLSLLIIVLTDLSNLYLAQTLLHPSTFWAGIFNWLIISLIIFVTIILKFVLVDLFGKLFNLADFKQSHFFNVVRLALMMITILNVVVAFTYFGLYQYTHPIFNSYYPLLLYSLLPIVLIIYIKLINASSYKKLHLFSYLCGTELIPYIFVLGLGLS